MDKTTGVIWKIFEYTSPADKLAKSTQEILEFEKHEPLTAKAASKDASASSLEKDLEISLNAFLWGKEKPPALPENQPKKNQRGWFKRLTDWAHVTGRVQEPGRPFLPLLKSTT